ncbi:hypothetical protein DSO57_1034187 [Entomophthora muscae]|uniref:Uncharacterized protein n=1 Tax=Entomophthora muscae TaxID=34485 RepID=A0ACC2SNT5_9FUNG|nr:hypothetical protein DSO57_1034187 [Entomophthora muscae]
MIKALVNYNDQYTFTAICEYAHSDSKKKFWKEVSALRARGLVVLFSDTNTVLDPLYDFYGCNKNLCLGSEAFSLALQELSLQDALVRRVNSFEYMTRINKYLKLDGFAGSRLDYFLVSIKFAGYFSDPEVIRIFHSDHFPLVIHLDLASPIPPRGPLIH